MDSPISSTIAEIYLQFWEEIYVKHWLENKEILYYKRYVDDILIICNQHKTNEQDILNQVNNIDKQLQFKLPTEESNIINYLDLTVYRNNNNIDPRIYRKPTGTNNITHFSSNLP